MPFRPASLVVALLAVLTAGCTIDLDATDIRAEGQFDRTLTVTAPVELDVQTGSGRIAIRQGTATEVLIRGEIRAHRPFWSERSAESKVRAIEANPPIVQTGNVIKLGEIEDRELRRNVSISYELVVPANTRVRSRTGSGTIDVESIAGPVEARTGSGRIMIGKVNGAIEAHTGSGSIDVLGAGQGLHARTGSGSIDARDVTGAVEAHTGSGRVRIVYAGEGDGEFSTGSGGISVVGLRGRMRAHAGSGSISIEGQPTGDWRADSGSGGITIRLPEDAAFEVNARSSSGGVHTSHPVEARGRISRNSLQGRVRGGGPRLDLSTGSGGIRLE